MLIFLTITLKASKKNLQIYLSPINYRYLVFYRCFLCITFFFQLEIHSNNEQKHLKYEAFREIYLDVILKFSNLHTLDSTSGNKPRMATAPSFVSNLGSFYT